jgi:hypothetical protein
LLKCRTAQWRRDRERKHAATVARLQAETARLRQRMAELENLVGQLKTRIWPRAKPPYNAGRGLR